MLSRTNFAEIRGGTFSTTQRKPVNYWIGDLRHRCRKHFIFPEALLLQANLAEIQNGLFHQLCKSALALEKIIGLGNEIFVAGAALDMFALSHFLALPTGQRSFFAIELGSVRKAK